MGTSIKTQAQNFLKKAGFYERFKSSCLYDLYWGVVDRRVINERSREIAFYKKTLEGFQPGSLVFDIGANEGYKTEIFLKLGARVVAVDPDPTNQEILRRRFLSYRLAPKAVTIVGKAVSEATTVATLWMDAPGSAKNTLSQKWVDTLREDEERFGQRLDFAEKREVQTTTLDEMIATHGAPYFVKIDVEGHEPSVLQGLTKSVPYLSFEVNLPEFRAEGLRCLDRLAEINGQGQFNFAVDCLGALAMERWVEHREFVDRFNQLEEASLEVFWRTHVQS